MYRPWCRVRYENIFQIHSEETEGGKSSTHTCVYIAVCAAVNVAAVLPNGVAYLYDAVWAEDLGSGAHNQALHQFVSSRNLRAGERWIITRVCRRVVSVI